MKKVLLFVSIGLLLLAIPATIFYLGQQKDLRAKAAPATTLFLTPANTTVNVGDTVKLNVTMDPGANQVVTADLYVTYDVTKLDAVSITNGANAPRILNSGTIENGTASIRVGAASNAQPITSAGTIAVITFTAKAATTAIAPAQVAFSSNTFVGGLNEPTANVLVGTNGSKITINGTASSSASLPTNTATNSATITPTLTPTLTPTQAASNSGTASSSAVSITTPTVNGNVTTTEPVIQGTAPPGSTVTIVIHSTPVTVTVTADANGNWTYTPSTPLDTGPHNVTVSVQTASGTTQTASSSFVIAAGAGLGGGTQSAMPVSGDVDPTILFIGLGLLLLGSGAVAPILLH